MNRTALLVTHTGRRDSTEHARAVARDLIDAGFTVRVMADEADDIDLDGLVAVTGPDAAEGAELVFALGGDGTLLRAAELARPAKAPLLGINLGKVGFLAEAEVADLDDAVRRAVAREYTVEERLTLDVEHYWAFTLRDAPLPRLFDGLGGFLAEHAGKLHHVHLPGYLPGQPEHRPMYCSRDMVLGVLTLLESAGFTGLIVSEVNPEYQNVCDLQMDILLFQRWRQLREQTQ